MASNEPPPADSVSTVGDDGTSSPDMPSPTGEELQDMWLELSSSSSDRVSPTDVPVLADDAVIEELDTCATELSPTFMPLPADNAVIEELDTCESVRSLLPMVMQFALVGRGGQWANTASINALCTVLEFGAQERFGTCAEEQDPAESSLSPTNVPVPADDAVKKELDAYVANEEPDICAAKENPGSKRRLSAPSFDGETPKHLWLPKPPAPMKKKSRTEPVARGTTADVAEQANRLRTASGSKIT